MNRGDSIDNEKVRHLMMAALDGEITADERRDLDRMLDSDPVLRKEWERMGRVKEVTRTMTFREPPEEVWDDYWTTVYNQVERGIGWILVSVGAVVVLSYGVWKWFEAMLGDTELPLFLRLAILTVAAGLIVLFVSVVREKLFTRKRDPYKEVQR